MRGTPSLAKLTTPRLGRVVSRARLLKRLDRLAGHKLIWIAAPAGSGKTTLAADWLGSRKRVHLWYQVDAGDQDLASFFNNLASAAERTSRLKRKLARFTPEYALGLPAFSRNFFRDLFARLKAPACIVFDNYQDVGEGNSLDTVLAHALDELPEGITLMALSRAGLPATLARHDANGQVAHLDATTLNLTPEEEAAVVKLTLGERKLKPDDLTRLHQATHGWMAGLLLALREVKARAVGDEASVIEAIADAPQQDPVRIFDYFATEVMARLDLKTREFLYAVALLPTMTATLCEQLTGNKKAKAILQRLVHEHFFTSRRGLLTVSYEFHPLFRQFLLAQAEAQIDRERLQSLKREAGRLLAEAGESDAAVALLSATEDWPTLAELIRAHGVELEKQGRYQTLQHWLNLMPEAERAKQAWLVYWEGVARLPLDPFAAYNLFERAFNQFRRQDDTLGQYQSWVGVASALFFRHDDMNPARMWIEELEKLRERKPGWPSLEVRGQVTVAALTILMIGYPEYPGLPEWLARTEMAYRLIPSSTVRCLIGSQLGLYYAFYGETAKLAVLSDQLQPLVTSVKIPDIARIMANSALVFAGWHLGEAQQAEQAIANGLNLLEESGAYITAQWFFGSAGIIMLSQFNVKEAHRFIEMFRDNSSPQRRAETAYLKLMSGWRFLIAGQLEAAKGDFESALEVALLTHALHFPLKALGGLVQTHTQMGEYTRARARLDELHVLSREAGNLMFSEFYCNYLEAYLLDRSGGDRDAVLSALRRSFESAVKHQWVVMSCWERTLITRLCVLALQHHIEPDYAKRLIRIYGLTPPTDEPIEHWPWPVRVYTLNRFAVQVDDKSLSLETRGQKKPLELLKAIIALGGDDVPLTPVLEALWPEAEGDAALRNFTIALHRLRQVVGSDSVIFSEQRLSLNPRRVWVDLWPFERLLSNLEAALAHGDTPQFSALQSETFGRYRRPFLDGDEAALAVACRERLRRKLLRLSETGAEALARAQDHHGAIQCCERGLEIEPLSEGLYRSLMKSQLALGERAAAVATYRRCHAGLQRDLGVAPSAVTEALYRQALGGG